MGKKGGGGSAPKPPDPYETARAEAQFNRFNTYSPSGSGVRYGYTDYRGNFREGMAPKGYQSAQTYIESPTEESIRLAVEPASIDLVNRIISDNIYNMPDAPRVKDRGTVADSIFNRAMSMLAPQIEQGEERLVSNLQNRGIPIGSEAWNDTYGAQTREVNDTISRLAMDADVAAGQEQSRLFGMDAAARQGSIAELVAAIGGGYNPMTNLPSGQGQPVNYSGLVSQNYQAELANWQAQQQARMGAAGAIGSLGAALIKSSEDFKDILGDVDGLKAATAIKAMPVRAWQYRPEHAPEGDAAQHIGPMAEHFREATGLGDGRTIAMVDYLGLLHAALQSALWRIDMLEYEMQGGRMQ